MTIAFTREYRGHASEHVERIALGLTVSCARCEHHLDARDRRGFEAKLHADEQSVNVPHLHWKDLPNAVQKSVPFTWFKVDEFVIA